MSSVLDLITRYRELASKKSVLIEIDVEEEKQKILKMLLAELATEAPLPFHAPDTDDVVNNTSKLRKFSYYLLLCFGVLEDVANSYFMGSALFLLLVPSISMSLLFIASLIYSLIEGVLFYMFDSYELRVALGVNDSKLSLSRLLNVYEAQIKLATTLNTHLAMMSTLSLSDENYFAYISLLSLVNNDLEEKLHLMEKKQESLWHWIFRMSVMLFGAISSLAGSYFMVTTLMSLVCMPMLTTPIGLAITVAIMVLGLAFHYFMDSTSLTRVINPNYDKFESVKESLSLFNKTYPKQGELLVQQRTRYKPLLAAHSLFKPEPAANSESVDDLVFSTTSKQR